MHSMKRDNVKCNVKFCVIICLDLKDGLTSTKVLPIVEFHTLAKVNKVFNDKYTCTKTVDCSKNSAILQVQAI